MFHHFLYKFIYILIRQNGSAQFMLVQFPGCILPLFFLALVTLPLLELALSYLPPRFAWLAWARAHRGGLARCSLYAFLIFCLYWLAMSVVWATAGPDKAVDVIKAEQVGIYDVKVVRSDTPQKLMDWLAGNAFSFDEADTSVFEDYIRRNWCFVVAQVSGSVEEADRQVVSEGLVAPLILRFETEKPVYPLSLTGTVGSDTQLLIYTLSPGKMDSQGRLRLRCARAIRPEILDWPLNLLQDAIDPRSRPVERAPITQFLCKFKDTLTPQQMRQDLEFSNAPDDMPYQEHVIVW